MIEISVRSIATAVAPELAPATDVVEVATRLRRPEVPAVVIVDDADEIVGIVTESDVVAVVAEGGGAVPAAEFMSRPVETTHPDAPIGIAADRMRDAGVAVLPIVDGEGSCTGVLTRDRLAPYLSRHRLAVEWQRDPLSLARGESEKELVAARE